jgi:hypothetical protein
MRIAGGFQGLLKRLGKPVPRLAQTLRRNLELGGFEGHLVKTFRQGRDGPVAPAAYLFDHLAHGVFGRGIVGHGALKQARVTCFFVLGKLKDPHDPLLDFRSDSPALIETGRPSGLRQPVYGPICLFVSLVRFPQWETFESQPPEKRLRI